MTSQTAKLQEPALVLLNTARRTPQDGFSRRRRDAGPAETAASPSPIGG